MPDDRLPKVMFKLCKDKVGTWSHSVGALLESINYQGNWAEEAPISLVEAERGLSKIHIMKWKDNIVKKPKLNYYRSVKTSYTVSNYVICNLPKKQRSLLSRLRNGSLQIRVESGRYVRMDFLDRICEMCNREVETALHFFLNAPN